MKQATKDVTGADLGAPNGARPTPSPTAGIVPPHRPSVPLPASDQDVRFSVGDVEMVIPAGTTQDGALNDAHLFTNTAKQLATIVAMNDHKGRVDQMPLFAISYLLELTEAMIACAHQRHTFGEAVQS